MSSTAMIAGTGTGTGMRAAAARRFGGPEVVGIERIPKPTPKRDEVLIRVHASTVSIADHRTRSRDLPKGLGFYGPLALGVFRPRKRVLGMDAAGVVEAVGDEVTGFAPGDEVIAMLGAAFGGHAQYVCVNPATSAVTRKPRNLGWEEAVALVFGGHTALAFLNHVEIVPGAEVLVNGASGAVGTAVVQLAKQRGARVTAVCSGGNAELARSLGADRVVDYSVEDFAAAGESYDVIVECVGNAPFERVGQSIRPGGALLLVITSLHSMLTASRDRKRSGKLVTFTGAPVSGVDLATIVRLAEAGEFRPVVDRVYDLDEIVEAHRYVDTGRKRGNVVLRIG
ncbi:NAD(P)-dependent alcohol dehydrogenase [Agromyces ramosus]|uniref:NADPH:quinone reductase-like Zn-dependent oxidoreductase n=1 Tax=Agromyces ramosus TaxID=33879 RepID=A0ABU0RBB7_9MICO|nr:NAD(P)-dependent alcohol dehydrogenase [Agromyces ramosus]MDQ0895057.1 NADPH:quinone reductase-like Zn-dependent oxidoreductase [Agromyces ramosus]